MSDDLPVELYMKRDRVRGAAGAADAANVQDHPDQRPTLAQQGLELCRVHSLLAERDAELRVLTQGVRDYAFFKLDTEGHISSWHPGAALMKGYNAEEAIGLPFEQLFTAADRAAGLPGHELRVAAETGNFKGDGQRLRKDGSTFDVATVLTALEAPDGQLLGYLELTQDISDNKRREADSLALLQAAQQARDEAERASRSKDEFLATISHELRTPLSAIVGWAQVLERGVSDALTVQHGLAAISRNARLQVQLIEDLLDMTRIDNGQVRLDVQQVELGSVVTAAVDAALPAATAKGISLQTTVSPAVDTATGDAARLQQVVAILLNNAIKFTPCGGRVNVMLTQLEGQAQIAVADTGQGIEPGFVLRLFDRFQQQDASTTRRHGGLGIGLYIARQLVQLHGGWVSGDSAGPGRGATFTVTLPTQRCRPPEPGRSAHLVTAASAHEQSAAPPPRSTDRSPDVSTHTSSRTSTNPSTSRSAALAAPAQQTLDQTIARLDGVSVLLVEDDDDLRAVTVQVLQNAGAHVLAAASADQALALLCRHRPAVLLSDIGMPEADGYELLRRVRALPAQDGGLTPAAAFTAYARPEDRQRVLSAGFQMFLAKPVLPTVLVSSVAALLRAVPTQPNTK